MVIIATRGVNHLFHHLPPLNSQSPKYLSILIMKAVTVASQGAEFKISEAPIPEPSDDQMLIKSIYAPVNPVFVLPKSAL
jgi:hypothetical protein